MDRTIGAEGERFLHGDEGCRLVPYDDATGKPVPEGGGVIGKLTIAWGHLVLPHEKHLQKPITQEQADELFRKDIKWAERAVNRALPNLKQHEFIALVRLVYNLGETQFLKSRVCQYLKAGNKESAILVWKQYINSWQRVKKPDGTTEKVYGINNGLINRRNAEIKMFLGNAIIP